MQKYEISQKLVQAIVNFLSTLPWNQVNQLLNSIALEVNENERILNNILIIKGGSLNLDVIFKMSDSATFRASLNKIIIFPSIKFSIHYVLKLSHQINFYKHIF